MYPDVRPGAPITGVGTVMYLLVLSGRQHVLNARAYAIAMKLQNSKHYFVVSNIDCIFSDFDENIRARNSDSPQQLSLIAQ